MATVTGIVSVGGVPLSGAKITGINTTEGIVQGVTTTGTDGTYSLEFPAGVTAHILMEYDDGEVQYNDKSKPFVVVESPAPSPVGVSGSWNILIQEEFEGNTLNTDLWGVNGGEFENPPDDDATNDAGHVTVANDTLTLEVSSDGTGAAGCYQGAISTYPGNQPYHATTGFTSGNVPGVFYEVRAELAGPRNGLLPAFWTNAFGPGSWPPEIDIYELFQTSDPPNVTETTHSGHWSTSEQPGDYQNHLGLGYNHEHGVDTTAGMHTYGAAWFRDRVEFWIDGIHHGTLDLLPLLNTLNSPNRNDMYMKFTTHVNRVGNADLTTAWTEASTIDYVRVWEWAGEPQTEPTPPAYTTIDTFDGGSLSAGWNDPNAGWATSTTYSTANSTHSLTNTANNAPIGWESTPTFAPGETGTRLSFDVAFGSGTGHRLNTRFGSDSATDGVSYRLDILDSDVFFFETSGWNAYHHNPNYSAGAAGVFYTVEIEFTTHNIRYEIRDENGTVVSKYAKYHTDGFNGPVFSFSAETGTVYIGNVRVASTS